MYIKRIFGLDQGLADLGNRIDEIQSIRTVHEHLVRLLSPEEQVRLVRMMLDNGLGSFSLQGALDIGGTFHSFEGLHPLQINSYTEPLWKVFFSHLTKEHIFYFINTIVCRDAI
jgi:hypothetical protein